MPLPPTGGSTPAGGGARLRRTYARGIHPASVPVSASEPSGEDLLAHVLVRVFAHAIDSAHARPQDRPPEVRRVPLELGLEEVHGGVPGPQELVCVVEVLPGLRDLAVR